MTQHEIARIFDQIADVLEFKGENVFRIRAYRRAAQRLESLGEDLQELSRGKRLTEIPGIGTDLAAKIDEYLSTGNIRYADELRRLVPKGLFELLGVPGIGPKTAKLLAERLKIHSVDQLEQAAKAHRLSKLPGFGATKEQNILRGIGIVKAGQQRMHLGLALPLARQLVDFLRALPHAKRVETAGSLRRMKETIGDLDLLVATTKPLQIAEAFTKARFCRSVLASGDTKVSIITTENVQVDLRLVKPDSFGAAWQYFTGSKEHNVRVRELAVRKGLKLNEYGLFHARTGKRLASREEEDIYSALGLHWIPPEIREDHGEIEAALARRLPRLVTPEDIRGDFHIHSVWSDGTNTLEELFEAGKKRSYQYLVMTDHSKSLKVAHGMTEERLGEQLKRIQALNRRSRTFQFLTGSEVDILADGRMDYADHTLSRLDVVIGSIHTNFTQDQETITSRAVRAIHNRYVTIMAHPTGRLMGQRDPYAIDLERVYQAARETGTALELNAYPRRLDLNDAAARRAKELGVRLVISTDTHALDQLDNIAIGIGVARRAWLEPRDLLNCLSRTELLAWIRRKREHANA